MLRIQKSENGNLSFLLHLYLYLFLSMSVFVSVSVSFYASVCICEGLCACAYSCMYPESVFYQKDLVLDDPEWDTSGFKSEG